MFEITGDDVAALGDEDLRTLIGLLGETEMRRRGLPTSAVTWGGDQTAKDGGLDVRVDLPAGTPVEGFVPKPQTGFQVKKSDMPRADIIDEMNPKPARALRPVIVELANADGAYIIVSSDGSTTDSALKSRRDAMAEAVKDTPAEGKLFLDFYDRNRVATWVRDHAGLIPWVRSRIGRAVPGWQSFRPWSLAPEGVEASYLADDHARIRRDDKDKGNGVSAVEGINQIRRGLSAPGHVVRLAGLSGVGKTRLAEALFDPGVGENALDPSLAIYTNIADTPNPPPVGLASDLNAGQTRAILVVDNCPPELHRQLSDVARAKGSTISVITIEYDIRDDQPEGTDVFRMDTSSIELIGKLVARRYPDLSQIDAQTIAKFSDGNARVALALASRIEKTERVADLSDEELFKRLFQQRHDPDPLLLSIAQACSLVYSFEGEKLDGDDAELPVLGTLIGKAADEVYAGAVELQRRDLVQARAQWRAVLPHAIANRLAKMALQNIPLSKVKSLLVDNASERLLRSFSRRLAYLDDSKEAKAIIEAWLAPGGLFGDVSDLSELGRAMFNNIAPVVPEAVLSALEAALAGVDDLTLRRCAHFVRLLRSLAYEPTLFERAIALLARFAALSVESEKNDEATSVVESLFYLILSGTHAPIEMRAKAVEALLGSVDKRMRAVGVRALEALLKTDQFMSHYDFDFGARSRDHGYHPSNGEEVRSWFAVALNLARTFALSDSPIAADVQKAITREFRDLWSGSGRAEQLDQLVRAIATKSFWRDGWIAARETRGYDGNAMSPELRTRLTALEEFLRPKDLINRVRGLVAGPPGGALDFEDFDDDEEEAGAEEKRAKPKAGRKHKLDYTVRAARAAAAIHELGHDVAADDETFRMLLPELMNGNDKERMFGEALAEAAENPRAMWDAIVAQFVAKEGARLTLLGGFLQGLQKRDATLANTVLDEALETPALAESFPVLQAVVPIDNRALVRLHRALDLGIAPITNFYDLAYGRACENVPGPRFRELVLAIARKPGGCPVGIEIISMRLHSDRDAKREPMSEVREAGRIALGDFEFHRKDGRTTREDYELGIVVKATLGGPEGAPVAVQLCRKLMAAAARHDIRAYDHDDLMNGLLRVHSAAVLDALFSGDTKSIKESVRFFQNLLRHRQNVFDGVSDDTLLEWCDHDPTAHYPRMASVAVLFKGRDESEASEWQPLIGKLLEKAPEPQLVLNEIVQRLHPSTWSGSLATVLEKRLKLLNALPGINAPSLAATVANVNARLQASIDAERRNEKEEARTRNNRFE
jgi:hypothetical protein